MKCKECEKHLNHWLDRELPPGQAKEVQAHLESCPQCQQRREMLEQGMAAVDSLPQMRASAGFDAALLQKLQDALEGVEDLEDLDVVENLDTLMEELS